MKTVIFCMVMQFIAFHFSMARIPDISQVGYGEMQTPLSCLYPEPEFYGSAALGFISDEEMFSIITATELQNTAGILTKNTSRQDTVATALQRAMNLMKEGKKEEASKMCLELMESHPDQREPVQMWLIMNMKRSPTGEEEAIGLLNELGKTYPQNTAIVFFRAFIEAEYGQNDAALADIEKLIQSQPDSSLNYILKGQVLSAQKKHQDAFEAFDRATALDPSRPDVWGMKASALAGAGKYDEAIAAISKAIEMVPGHPVAIYNRACIYCLKGDRENALADLKKAVSIDAKLKETAKQDADFTTLYNDEEFKKLTAATE